METIDFDVDEIDDSQWWENYQELEYAWEQQAGIYDPPVW